MRSHAGQSNEIEFHSDVSELTGRTMNLGRVIGNVTSTVKHHSMNGWRLLIVQPLTADGGDDGEPLLVIDSFGARIGNDVILCSDGKLIGELMNSNSTPVRWMVLGQPDN